MLSLSMFPTELLTLVFRSAYASAVEEGGMREFRVASTKSAMQMTLCMASICQRWRMILLDIPDFWIRLYMGPCAKHVDCESSVFATLASRSSGLSIVLELDRVSGANTILPKEICRRIRKLRIAGNLDELNHGISLLRQHDSPQYEWSTRDTGVAAVALEIVHYATPGEKYEETDISPALGTSLCDLRLEGIRLAPQSQPGQLSTLVLQDVALTIKEIRHIIVGARVRHLVLRNIQVPPGLNIYDLEHLERARKNDHDTNPCARLETLHIESPGQGKTFHDDGREPLIDYSSFFSDIFTHMLWLPSRRSRLATFLYRRG
ncbi:hypothetical protein BKA70DRAFT_1433440 [Coprinopsis sp. MPI-PUGE-AT-0042]|nr:hypothetical protein BKA70DRAFT_1433440 [Coprinopsis sp. MPI-PUGE-AT-0042]